MLVAMLGSTTGSDKSTEQTTALWRQAAAKLYAFHKHFSQHVHTTLLSVLLSLLLLLFLCLLWFLLSVFSVVYV